MPEGVIAHKKLVSQILTQLFNKRKFSIFILLISVLGISGSIVADIILRPWTPPIHSDGFGYYIYLPAVFIYHDLSLQSINDFFTFDNLPIFQKMFQSSIGTSLYGNSANYLIKYPMGTALLMMPFFLIACIFQYMTNSQVDGYSPIFNVMMVLSGLFYGVVGIGLLWKVLEKHYRQNTIIIVLVGLIFGTNLFNYMTFDAIFSHVYSFCIFSAFLYTVQKTYSENNPRYFIIGGALAGLTIITRPTNGLWLLFGVVYGVDSFKAIIGRFDFWKKHLVYILYGTVMGAGMISMQLVYWKIITGHFIVYSYGKEGFNFGSPEIFNVLFSVEKGLFFWSPIFVLALIGLIYVRKSAKEFLTPILLFLPLNIYIISSWWCWTYGSTFGQRAFIESIPIFAISLCAFYEGVDSTAVKRTLVFLILLCISLESWLMLKYWIKDIPGNGVTWDFFINTFFIF